MTDNVSILTASQRREQIEHSKFIEIRQLASHTYVDPDTGKCLMTYQQTLEDRDAVKQAVLAFELKMGDQLPAQFPKSQFVVVSDGTETTVASSPVVNPNPPPGVPMTIPFSPAPIAPEPSAVPSPSGPPSMAPPPPVASPLQAVQAASQVGDPQPQTAPISAPVMGKKRGRPAGVSVAPPPPAAVAAPPSPVAAAPTAPPASQGPAAFVPQFLTGMQQVPSQPAQVQSTPASLSTASMDLDPLMGEIKELKGALATLLVKNTEVQKQNSMLLACLHHLYLSEPRTAQNTQGKANTLPEFIEYLRQFLPQ